MAPRLIPLFEAYLKSQQQGWSSEKRLQPPAVGVEANPSPGEGDRSGGKSLSPFLTSQRQLRDVPADIRAHGERVALLMCSLT